MQAAVSGWMVQLETVVRYKDGLTEALSARCALLIQVTISFLFGFIGLFIIINVMLKIYGTYGI